MSTLKTPIIFTGNRLRDGEVVWLGPNGRWVENVDAAHVIHTETDRDVAATLAANADASNIIVEPYEIEVSVEGSSVVPVRFREQIRAAGPTIRLDLGKQAAATAQAA